MVLFFSTTGAVLAAYRFIISDLRRIRLEKRKFEAELASETILPKETKHDPVRID